MRKSRSIQLHPESGIVHVYGRCHNRSHNFKLAQQKRIYIQALWNSLQREQSDYFDQIEISSFCIMDNHTHSIQKYRNGCLNLSKHLRFAHSENARQFNRNHQRSGAFGESRPKTSLIQNEHYEMIAHMYIEANPIRAGLCKLEELKLYKFCSYRFYAYGIQDEFTKNLKIPQWYLSLGKTKRERQAKYRKLFAKYLRETTITKASKKSFYSPYFGNIDWVMLVQRQQLRNLPNDVSPPH